MNEQTGEKPRKSILVVDDNPDMLETIADVLERDGYRVLRARNGIEALKVGTENQICLVLLDLLMPVMDGWEFLEERKHAPRLSRVPVVVLSAESCPPPKHANARLKKPVRADVLREVASSYC